MVGALAGAVALLFRSLQSSLREEIETLRSQVQEQSSAVERLRKSEQARVAELLAVAEARRQDQVAATSALIKVTAELRGERRE